MKLLNTKEERLKESFIEYLKSMNLDSPNELVEEIDNKLEKLYQNLEYDDYIKFIKNNKYLETYDTILGNYANNIPLSKNMIDMFTPDFYQKINTIIDNKLKELGL